MAVRVLTLGKDDIPKILINGISRPIENAQPFFSALAAKMFQQSIVTFKRQGARSGNPQWTDFGNGEGVHYYQNKNTGVWAKRPGTDKSKTRRYEAGSNLLQASGSFRNSFTIIKVDKRRSIVGTKLKLAKAIMSNPDRPVLFVNDKDYALYTAMFRTFVDKGIKF